jgi:hypothetical protein
MTEGFAPRRAEPGQKFDWVDGAGKKQSMTADDEGIVRPKDAEDERIANLFDLSVARTVQAEEREKADDKPAAKSGGKG